MELPQESPSPEEAKAASSSDLSAAGPDDAVESLELRLPDEAATPREIGLWAGVIVLLTAAVYWPSTDGTLLWTDLLRNANPGTLYTIWVQRWVDVAHYPLSQYHPLAFTLDWFIFHVFGRNGAGAVLPFGYHVVSLILHCAAAVGLWRVLHKLRLPGAWTAAMLFAVLPINAETVSWISQLGTLLAGALAIGSVYCYLRFQEEPASFTGPQAGVAAGWYAGAAGLYVLAMLSKSTAWAVPAITLALLAWRHRGTAKDAVLLLPWLVVGIVLTVAAAAYERQVFTNAGDASAWSVSQHLVVVGRTFWFYLGKALLPFGLSLLYPITPIDPGQPAQWIPLVGMLAVAGVLVALATKVRGPLVALLGYVLALSPAMGVVYLITMRQSLYADHEAYLASAALTAGVVGVVATALRRVGHHDAAAVEVPPVATASPAVPPPATLTPAVVLSGVVILIAGAVSLAHSRVFLTPVRLWTDVVAKDPQSGFAHNRLALADAEAAALDQREGDTDTYTALMDTALVEAQTAAELDPLSGESQSTWGRILSSRSQDKPAIAHLTRAVQLSPKLMEARIELAAVLLRDGQVDDSIRELDDALQVQSRPPIVHRLLGEAYDQKHQTQRAIAEQQQAIEIDPNDLKAHEDLAALLSSTGDDKDAIGVLRDYVAAHDSAKSDPVLWNALGRLTARTGDMATAISFFKAALSLDPTMDEASKNMDLAQGALDKQQKAAATRAATQATTTATR